MALIDTLSSHPDQFVRRHNGSNPQETVEMLAALGFKSLDELVDAAVPKQIRAHKKLNLPPARSEFDALADIRQIASQNQVFRSFIGQGYYDCITPAVIVRNVLENPGWYTQYTPYQAEISQGRLEALLNFQTMIADLTGLDIANASLLDEATACAEAMMMAHRLKGSDTRNTFFISDACHPQNIEVVRTRGRALGFEVVVGSVEALALSDKIFGVLVQYPDTFGVIHDFAGLAGKVHEAGALFVVAADLLALTLIKAPGEFGADMAVGSAQRFGVPLGYGGPNAGFFATRDEFKRQMPGRLVGVSKDTRGQPALRLALGTREQHIRREKATSNICTAQALLANMSALYACYHGPEGLKQIAERVHGLTAVLAAGLEKLGHKVGRGTSQTFFDTITVAADAKCVAEIVKTAEAHRINFRRIDAQTLGISLDETTSPADVAEIWQVFNHDEAVKFTVIKLASNRTASIDNRQTKYLRHPVFSRYHSETEMLATSNGRVARSSLTASMIPLGSCTMKLNAAAEMFPISWPEFSRMHPFAPLAQARGYQMLFQNLEDWLAE